MVQAAGLGTVAANSTNIEADLPLTHLSLHELRNVEVSSVSRKEELWFNAPAAVHVITEEDIRRGGFTSIPEALRMVPGLSVARINANKWAISSRGFNNRFANKMLVLRDGRAVYTPVFSGVYWDVQDTMLEDIERIEVIEGPGGTLWGANAVNGIINIITKSAKETQGMLVTGTIGTEEHGGGGIRYGGKLASNAWYRVYAKGFNRDDFREIGGREGSDEWWQQREGFRIDWEPTDNDLLTFQGDYYYGRSGDRLLTSYPTPPFARFTEELSKASGFNALSRWTRSFSEDSDLTLQAYYDKTKRDNLTAQFDLDTFDIDAQHRIALGDHNEVTYGLGYRLAEYDIRQTSGTIYNPADRVNQLVSGFVQDRIEIIDDKLWLTLGTKLEHNDYSNYEVQPSARLLFKPTPDQSMWAAVSRAVRTPAIFEHKGIANVPISTTTLATISGNPDFDSEKLIAYETGYRVQPFDPFTLDLSLFYHDYDNLRTSERGLPSISPGRPVIVPITYANNLEGSTYGFSLAPTWRVTEEWRLNFGYTFLEMHMRYKPGSTEVGTGGEGDSPQNQFHVRSLLDLPYNLEFDVATYYVDNLANQHVPSYVRLDARLGWKPRHDLEISAAFQNLLDPRHPEFGPSTLVTPTEIERAVHLKVTWRF